ncbi:MAG: glucodextranase DOMON-like domain-containing protein [Candidatus Omnitrophica bacterium]|nr:glucodextranase DOMON-like domain-containing protein [Candidatus Omnitrophota bacterium]MDD5310967.1 glucodextranase DOMON-like domain-containing protein [Candidatus Omnitrophota bacterium]MDD5546338.1 glucodextranase DOMON-like domain-containing protein [Candidatus Omnitrophota bacterium]
MKRKANVLFYMFVALGVIFTTQRMAGAFSGHPVLVGGATNDWIGTTPSEPNSWTISGGEYIWKDGVGDDTGNGSYTYPLQKALKGGCDLREFRLSYDDKNLYLLIKCDRPGDFWPPLRIIGIHKEGTAGGMTLLAQGDANEPDFDKGVSANLKVAPELACQYVIAISSSAYKGRIWDAEGKLVARKEGEKDDTPDFKVEGVNWNHVEAAIPLELIGGSPAGQVWKIVIAIGQQDFDVARKIDVDASEWNGGGGAPNNSNPYVYDLAGADKETQEKELGSYNPNAPFGDPDGFAVITKSFLKIDFRNEGPGKLSRRGENGTETGFLSGVCVFFPALLSR